MVGVAVSLRERTKGEREIESERVRSLSLVSYGTNMSVIFTLSRIAM